LAEEAQQAKSAHCLEERGLEQPEQGVKPNQACSGWDGHSTHTWLLVPGLQLTWQLLPSNYLGFLRMQQQQLGHKPPLEEKLFSYRYRQSCHLHHCMTQMNKHTTACRMT